MNEDMNNDLSSPDAESAIQQVDRLLQCPGPFLSAYVDSFQLDGVDPVGVFDRRIESLIERGATNEMVEAARAALMTKLPSDVGGRSVHVAGDASTTTDVGTEGVSAPLIRIDSLPVAGPLLEWDQWRVGHLAVTVDAWSHEIVEFPTRRSPRVIQGGDADEILQRCRELAASGGIRLIAIRGEHRAADELRGHLAALVPVQTRVVVVGTGSTLSDDEFSAAVVRHVADVVARDTVQALQDYRFARSGGGSAAGPEGTLAALKSGEGRLLLVHDDPEDSRRASFGSEPADVSSVLNEYPADGRLVDVAIQSAIRQGIDVRIVPTTSSNGPAEGIGLILDARATQVE